MAEWLANLPLDPAALDPNYSLRYFAVLGCHSPVMDGFDQLLSLAFSSGCFGLLFTAQKVANEKAEKVIFWLVAS